jgi:hypothetical protein
MIWARNIARIGTNTYKLTGGKNRKKETTKKTKKMFLYNIDMDVRDI